MTDRQFIELIAKTLAGAKKTRHACPIEGCNWAIWMPQSTSGGSVLARHLREDPRHTGGRWTDRDGNERVGLI